LAAWGSAWLQGNASFDAALDAVLCARPSVAGAGFEHGTRHPVSVALTEWKQTGAERLRLVLPVPGDVRGLSGPADFRSAALANGQAVLGLGFGVTCAPAAATPSSAPRPTVWQRGPGVSTDPAADGFGVADAEYELAEAIRETASLLTRRDAPSWLTDVAPALSDARRAGERLHLPASHPPRAVRLIAQAERMAAVLELVDSDGTGEITAAGSQERQEMLQPLRRAVRQALTVGYSVSADVAAY
jgi:hypothetical protein